MSDLKQLLKRGYRWMHAAKTEEFSKRPLVDIRVMLAKMNGDYRPAWIILKQRDPLTREYA